MCDRLSSYRWYLTWKGELCAFAIGAIPGVAVAIAYAIAYSEAMGWNETVLQAARCEWWDFNADVVRAAAAKGIDVTAPTAANPNGYAPYSVHYESCQFCGWAQTSQFTVRQAQPRNSAACHPLSFLVRVVRCAQVLTLIINLGATFGLAVGCFLIRKVHDQHFIWKELTMASVLAVVTLIIPATGACMYCCCM